MKRLIMTCIVLSLAAQGVALGRDNVSAAEEDAKRSVDPVEDSEILQELFSA